VTEEYDLGGELSNEDEKEKHTKTISHMIRSPTKATRDADCKAGMDL